MANRTRTNRNEFHLDDKEQYILDEKFKLSGMKSKSAFLRKLILYGYVYDVDYSFLREYNTELGRISSSLNQIAKRINSTNHVYQEDMDEVKELMKQVWQSQKSMLSQQPLIKRQTTYATMIYCDYGALSTSDRKTIMRKVYNHLKSGGKFLLDVFSMEKYKNFQENQIWEICPSGGFWSNDDYIALNKNYKYSDTVTLEHISIISKNEITTYYLWNTYFTVKTLTAEAMEAGFKISGLYSDVAGNNYQKNSATIAILLEK